MGYNTVQRKAVIDFLASNRDKQFTVEEIAELMSQEPEAPGKSSIYRIITKLVSDGEVKRFVKGQSRQFVYQTAGCSNHSTHIHLKCKLCGRLLHLNSSVSDRISAMISEVSSFDVDKEETVIFGVCAGCKGA